MTNLRWARNYEGLLLALAPLAGLLATYFHELGRFSYFDVPQSFLEISTPRVIAAVIGIALFFIVYIVSWAEDFRLTKKFSLAQVVVWHIFSNAILTAIFWLKLSSGFLENLFLGLACTVTFTIGTVWLYRAINKQRDQSRKPASQLYYVFLALYLFGMFSAASFLSGYVGAKGEKYWLARASTHQILVGTFNGQYILKEYRPADLSLVKGKVILQPPESQIVFYKLEKRPQKR